MGKLKQNPIRNTVDYQDVEAVDPEYYKSLVWIL
jgi:hypothetical protein